MAPYYEGLCKDLKWQLDSDLLSRMKKANDEELKRLDDVLEDAEKNLGESEIRDAMMAKAEYLIRIGDKVGALSVRLLQNIRWEEADERRHGRVVTNTNNFMVDFYSLVCCNSSSN